MLLFLESGKS